MIKLATKDMIPALKDLWVEAFSDPESYAMFFFDNRFDDIDTYVYLVDSNPVSMAFVFQGELYHNQKYIKAWYIYGVATSVSHRSKGYSTKVLEHIKDIYSTTFLVPATKRLFEFYGRNGYKVAFGVNEEKQCRGQLIMPNVSYGFETISPKEYKDIRDKIFGKEGYVMWDLKTIDYAIKENTFLGGFAYKISSLEEGISNKDIILFRYYENELYIKETTLTGQKLYDVAAILMNKNGITGCHIRLPINSSSEGRDFAMISSAHEIENGYCNLVLD